MRLCNFFFFKQSISKFRQFRAHFSMGRGAFIVFEGLDRSGKTTQSNKLIERLKNEKIDCQLQRFPDRTTSIGKMISDYLTNTSDIEDHAVHLLFTANRWEKAPKIQELLEQGVTVIVDRYSYSGVVYTAAKKGFSIEWCKQPEVGLPQPDLVIFLYTSAHVLGQRSDFGDERYESQSFQSQVLANYVKLKQDDWMEIDASQSIESIHEEIFSSVRPLIDSVRHQPIKSLWTLESENQVPVKNAPVKPTDGPVKTTDR